MPERPTDRLHTKSIPIVSRPISRRGFLTGSARVLALAGGASTGFLISCTFDDEPDLDVRIPNNTAAYAENVPPPPSEVNPERLGFFSPQEAETVDAFTARLMPGSPEDPGAREAGVVTYLDVKLATVTGFWEPTYVAPPFAETYTGEAPPEQGPPFEQIFVAEDQIDRYGFQSRLTPREIYRMGLRSVDQLAQQRFGSRFAELSEDDQDAVIEAIADDEAPTFDEPSAELFFDTIREDTAHAMFSDPAYGGNRNMVGWRLIGYPGAQRAYTAADLQSEDEPRPPQSLAQLHEFHAGVPMNPGAVEPVSDPDPRNQQVPAERE